MLDHFASFFWPWGVIIAALGFVASDVAGYAFHRFVLHAMILFGEKHREDGGRFAFLFVPWKVAWEKHMWHHYLMYPDPNPPGGIVPGPFRPRHEYYNGLELAKHKFGSVPSENPRFDYVEWLFHKIGLRVSLDWLIMSSVFALLMWFVIADAVAFTYFLAGGIAAGGLNAFSHASFHVLPYPKLREVPVRAWLRPSVALANLGEHLPVFRNLYRFLFLRHLAHHYRAVKADDGNRSYRGVFPNANLCNFTMFNPLTDILFGTYWGKDYEEIRIEENDRSS